MHYIVTGGAGFIGSHLSEQILNSNNKVTIVDNLSTGSLDNLPQHKSLSVVQKNVLDCQPQDFNDSVDGLVHLAATPSVPDSWIKPLECHHNNLSATMAALQLCQQLEIPKFVLISSAAVYDPLTPPPISESSPTNPISPYGLQKLFSEQYVSLFAKKISMSGVILRLFNCFGPRQNPHSPYSGVVSIFVNAMQQGLPINIYGNGEQTRDFIYVKDVANAIEKSLDISLQPGQLSTVNIGTGKSISLLQLLDILKTNFPDWNNKIQFNPSRLGDIKHSQADISKAISELEFVPTWSMQSGIESLLNYRT